MQSANSTFLASYHHHVIGRWRQNYISYDGLRSVYKEIKNSSSPKDPTLLELAFHMEIKRVNEFVDVTLLGISHHLDEARADIEELMATKMSTHGGDVVKAKETKKSKKGNHDDDDDEMNAKEKIMDQMIREVYEDCTQIAAFVDLNLFAIDKVAKKFRKLCPKPAEQVSGRDEVDVWAKYESFIAYREMVEKVENIKEVTQRCEGLYCTAFRSTYPELAHAELHFRKDKHQQLKQNRIWLGVKLGIIACLVAFLIIVTTEEGSDSAVLFLNPAVYVFTTIGTILLYRLLWAYNVWLWKETHVNYSDLLKLGITQPNPLSLLEDTSMFFMLYCINLTMFVQLGVRYAESIWINVLPLALVVTTLAFVLKHSTAFIHGRRLESTGSLFDRDTWVRCFTTPFVPVTFRDNFAADILTSFTKPMSDGVHGLCWIASGSFLKHDQQITNYGSSYLQCNSEAVAQVASVYIVILPILIRFLQCSRDMYDKGTWYPQLLNAMKYLSAMAVILYGLKGDKSSSTYYALIVFSAIYKWLWDVIMDWDLLYVFRMYPKNWMLLRKDLLYSPPLIYYVAIFMDLVLRFVWMISLAPTGSGMAVLNTSQFNFFFGSLEILRRAMWNHFRMEYEHLKHIKKNSIGYIERKSSTVGKTLAATSGRVLMHRSKSVLRDRTNSHDNLAQALASFTSDKYDKFAAVSEKKAQFTGAALLVSSKVVPITEEKNEESNPGDGSCPFGDGVYAFDPMEVRG
jgi:hypothetical protein